jgi:hypothetical protein
MTARCGPSVSQYDEAAHDDRPPGFLGRQRTPIVLAGVGLALGLLAFWLYPRPGELPNPSYDTVTVTSKFPVGIIDYSVDQVTSATTQRVSDATVVWNEQVTGGEAAGRVAVGINHGNQAWNDDKTFIAGAFIGLAGGALLSALQELLRQKDQPGPGSQR